MCLNSARSLVHVRSRSRMMVKTTDIRWLQFVFATAVLLTASICQPNGQSGTDDSNIDLDRRDRPMQEMRDTVGDDGEEHDGGKAVRAAEDQISCTFDDGHLCGWKQATDDDFDWTPHSGSTPTKGTGPSGGDQGTPYIYAEVSNLKEKRAKTTIYTDYFAPGEYSFSFKWHMFGKPLMGKLRLSMVSKTGSETVLFRKSGNHGDLWQSSEHNFTATEDSKLVITGSKRVFKQGDIALDTFVMKKLGDYKLVLSCDFENDRLCSYLSDKRGYYWVTKSGPTPVAWTGPRAAYNGNFYIYAHAGGVIRGAKTKLYLRRINSNALAKPFCLTFAYNMHGCHMGALRIRLVDVEGRIRQPIWSAQGDKGYPWKKAKIHVDRADTKQVVFEAERGWGYRSDIALDLIQIHTASSCPK